MLFPRGRQPQAILRRAVYLIPVVLRHKWCMLLEAKRCRVPWRTALAHDSDKFRLDYLWLWIVCGEIKQADRLHKHRTPHSWEYWANNDDTQTYRPMSEEARHELLADWRAKQRAQGGRDYARRAALFYDAHRDSFGFHPSTRAWVEEQLKTF